MKMYLELVKLLSLEIKALLSFSFLLQYRELNETFLDRRMTQETVHRLGNEALRVSSMIWTEGENNLKTFLNYINSIHPTIKFTHEYSDSPGQTLPFLDVQVHLNNNQIQTDLHTKPTDKHQYLFKTSCHPTHTKFTHEYSNSPNQTLPFQDVQVHVNNNQIQTDPLTKPTDKHQYLLKTSCHPTHTKPTIPFSLALRLRRICSTDDFFQ